MLNLNLAPSLPPGVEIVTGYDRSWLINESIKTLKRDLIALSEAIVGMALDLYPVKATAKRAAQWITPEKMSALFRNPKLPK